MVSANYIKWLAYVLGCVLVCAIPIHFVRGQDTSTMPPHLQRLVRDLRQQTDNIKSQEHFGAQLWLTANPAIFQDWPKTKFPCLEPTNAAHEQPIFAVLCFYGPTRNPEGVIDVTYDVVVQRPDGSTYSEQKGAVAGEGIAPNDERLLHLSRSYLKIAFLEDEPFGLYTVILTVHDQVAHVDLTLKQTLTHQ